MRFALELCLHWLHSGQMQGSESSDQQKNQAANILMVIKVLSSLWYFNGLSKTRRLLPLAETNKGKLTLSSCFFSTAFLGLFLELFSLSWSLDEVHNVSDDGKQERKEEKRITEVN